MSLLNELARLPDLGQPIFKTRTVRTGDKIRILSVPNEAMGKIHKRLIGLLKYLLKGNSFVSAHSYGAFSGGTVVDNALRHIKSRYFYQLDIQSAFDNVSLERLAWALSYIEPRFGLQHEVLEFLSTYCAGPKGGLATGAPASPILFDIYCKVLIDNSEISRMPDLVYTRFADDITVSSSREIPSVLRQRIREIVAEAGFDVSRHKSKVLDRTRGPVTVTGVVITPESRIRPSDVFVLKVSELLRALNASRQPNRSDMDRLAGMNGFLNLFRSIWFAGSITSDTGRLISQVAETIRQNSPVFDKPGAPYNTAAHGHRFSQSELDYLRSMIPLTSLIAETVPLKRAGGEMRGPCPFHNEKTPSFYVNDDKGFYHCFGCGAHGDAIRWMTEIHKMGFVEAVQFLSSKYGTGQDA